MTSPPSLHCTFFQICVFLNIDHYLLSLKLLLQGQQANGPGDLSAVLLPIAPEDDSDQDAEIQRRRFKLGVVWRFQRHHIRYQYLDAVDFYNGFSTFELDLFSLSRRARVTPPSCN